MNIMWDPRRFHVGAGLSAIEAIMRSVKFMSKAAKKSLRALCKAADTVSC